LAAKIQEALGATPDLIPDGRGIFDVVADGHLVYSKFQPGSFPDEETLVADLVQAQTHGI
jgi:predicted Rdx family selenoprotein